MSDRLYESEKIAALTLLPCHAILFPLLINLFQLMYPGRLGTAQSNLLYYCASLLLCLCFMGRYVLRSSKKLFDEPLRLIKTFAVGAVILLVLSFICTGLVRTLGVLGSDPNSESVHSLMSSERVIMLVLTLLLAPAAEELLFRGGVFCTLYEKNRTWAYVITVLLFSIYHVWQYALAKGEPRYLLYALVYVPPSVALCYVYEKSDSIAASIIFHMGYNLVAQLTSR